MKFTLSMLTLLAALVMVPASAVAASIHVGPGGIHVSRGHHHGWRGGPRRGHFNRHHHRRHHFHQRRRHHHWR